jgi:esterase/lipase superfamily enzyme
MGVAIYGNYGGPILAFPTSCGDESEMEGQGMIRTLAPYIEQGRIRIFCINGVQSDSFANKRAHRSVPIMRPTLSSSIPTT